jgi:toxin ParE1/3/4
MKRAAFAVHQRADADLDEALDYYLTVAGEVVAYRLVDAVEAAHQTIWNNPEIGSGRLSEQLSIPNLRTLIVRGFPYLVAYYEADRDVEILRLIHGQRDLSPELFDLGD